MGKDSRWIRHYCGGRRMIKHSEARMSLKNINDELENIDGVISMDLHRIEHYITQQQLREGELLMRITEYGVAEMDFKKLVKEYFTIISGAIDSEKALRQIELEKIIKEKVGVENNNKFNE
jgi:hypothetical protein